MANGDDDSTPTPQIRLMDFVSEEQVGSIFLPPPPPLCECIRMLIKCGVQLEEARRSRGSRVEDGTAQRDRSLYEVLVLLLLLFLFLPPSPLASISILVFLSFLIFFSIFARMRMYFTVAVIIFSRLD